jgi:hypothetical protein
MRKQRRKGGLRFICEEDVIIVARPGCAGTGVASPFGTGCWFYFVGSCAKGFNGGMLRFGLKL